MRRQKPPAPTAASARGSSAHSKLSCASAHQVDEHVLERGLGALPCETRPRCDRARSPPRAPRRRGRKHAGWCRTAPPCRRRGVCRASRASSARSRRPLAHRVGRRDATSAITSSTVPCASSSPIGDIGDLVAALGLVHVVGGDEHGEALARRARGSRSRTRAAPWDRRPRSARRAAAAAGSAACRRRARAAASSRPRASPRAAPRGPSSPSRSIIVARRARPDRRGRRRARRIPGSRAPKGPDRG